MKRDRFQTAGRLAEAASHEAPADPRELMRPLTPAEVREREFVEVKAKREFQRWTVDRYVWLALCRILFPSKYGTPGIFDANILAVMDDVDIAAFCYDDDDRRRLALFRDNLRRKLS